MRLSQLCGLFCVQLFYGVQRINGGGAFFVNVFVGRIVLACFGRSVRAADTTIQPFYKGSFFGGRVFVVVRFVGQWWFATNLAKHNYEGQNYRHDCFLHKILRITAFAADRVSVWQSKLTTFFSRYNPKKYLSIPKIVFTKHTQICASLGILFTLCKICNFALKKLQRG